MMARIYHQFCLILVTILLADFVQCGTDDTLLQLEVAYGNLDLNSAYEQVDVLKVLYGGSVGVPADIEGSFVRHGCGVLGHSLDYQIPNEPLDRITHLFDCIPVVQAFHFHEGRATFTSKFYNTTKNDIYRDTYNQEMRDSSVFWRTTFSEFNQEQVDKHMPDFQKPKLGDIPHVSWWTIGTDVFAMSEYPGPLQVDPHNGRHMDTTYNLGSLPDGDAVFNPAHQAFDESMGLISSTGIINIKDKQMTTKRVVYVTNGGEKLNVTTEIPYSGADLSECDKDGLSNDQKLRYVHSIAATDNYIVIPETSYLLEPCDVFYKPNNKPFFKNVAYDNTINGRFIVIPKADTTTHEIFEAGHHFFITHLFNAFEKDGMIHVDALKYENADLYEKHTQVVEAIYSEDRAENKIMRYSMKFDDSEKKVEHVELMKQPEDTFVEFNNINPNYYGKDYQYAYAVRNVFGLHNAIVKFDFKNNTEIAYELPNGEFGTEPIFVPSKRENATEDEGWVLVQTIDGTAEKVNMLILRAENMVPEFKAQAPELGLHGLHSGFFPFDIGCTLDEGCVPEKSGANHLMNATRSIFSLILTFIIIAFNME